MAAVAHLGSACQSVNDVLTVVETRRRQVWCRYLADIAIVFQLSHGVVAVAKVLNAAVAVDLAGSLDTRESAAGMRVLGDILDEFRST